MEVLHLLECAAPSPACGDDTPRSGLLRRTLTFRLGGSQRLGWGEQWQGTSPSPARSERSVGPAEVAVSRVRAPARSHPRETGRPTRWSRGPVACDGDVTRDGRMGPPTATAAFAVRSPTKWGPSSALRRPLLHAPVRLPRVLRTQGRGCNARATGKGFLRRRWCNKTASHSRRRVSRFAQSPHRIPLSQQPTPVRLECTGLVTKLSRRARDGQTPSFRGCQRAQHPENAAQKRFEERPSRDLPSRILDPGSATRPRNDELRVSN